MDARPQGTRGAQVEDVFSSGDGDIDFEGKDIEGKFLTVNLLIPLVYLEK